MKRPAKPPEEPKIIDQPGMVERFQRGLQRALNLAIFRNCASLASAWERCAAIRHSTRL